MERVLSAMAMPAPLIVAISDSQAQSQGKPYFGWKGREKYRDEIDPS